MRVLLGSLVLVLGVAGLGLWAHKNHAKTIESKLTAQAEKEAALSRHAAKVVVRGRDITVTGLADSQEEREALIAALNGIDGRRVVNDGLQVLAEANPWEFILTKDEGAAALQVAGHLPSEAARLALEPFVGEGLDGLQLASGGPKAWDGLAEAAIAALAPLDFGKAVIRGDKLTVTGQARDVAAADTVAAVLAGVTGAKTVSDLQVLDDGTPAVWTLDYTAAEGARLGGKLPMGLEADALRKLLGLTALKDESRVAHAPATGGNAVIGKDMGQAAGQGGQGVLKVLSRWLPQLEEMKLTSRPDSTDVFAGFGSGTDLDLMKEVLAAELADQKDVTLQVEQLASGGADGDRRVNAASGQTEIMQNGFWLPQITIVPSPQACADAADAVLSTSRINFVTGSARLDGEARGVISQLAAVVLPCTQTGGLSALIGGHTDATGDNAANLTLSQARAEAVRLELIARGVTADRLTAKGFGAERPLDSNQTEEGKAANRRTTIDWAE